MNRPDKAVGKPPESTIGENMGQGKGSDVIASESPSEGGKAEPKWKAALAAANAAPRKKPKSLRKAINEYCKWCIHDPLSGLGTWRQQVEGCTSTECPLYDVRPKADKRKKNED